MKSIFKSLAVTGGAIGALLSLGVAAYADAIPYPAPGVEAPANLFTAASTGTLTAYFYGSSASYNETLGIQVNGATVANDLFPNHSTAQGDSYTINVKAGDSLVFFINVLTTGDTWSSLVKNNPDGYNHAYATAYTGGVAGIPAGTFVGFEDLTTSSFGPGTGQPNYDDEDFVFTNTMSTVPLPASAPMFGAALVGLAGLGYAAKRKKAAAAV